MGEQAAAGDAATANTFVYTITYDRTARTTTTVTLTAEAGRRTPTRRWPRTCIARASDLPDVSVEQMFLSGESYPGRARAGTSPIRTTEKQPELVRATPRPAAPRRRRQAVARCSAAVTTYAARSKARYRGSRCRSTANGAIELEFSKPTSRAYVQELFEREFRTERASTASRLVRPDRRRRARWTAASRKMKLDVSKNPAFDKLASAEAGRRPRTRPDWQLALLGQDSRRRRSGRSTPRPSRSGWRCSTASSPPRRATKALYAIIASWIAILLYLWFRFGNWTFGLAAVLCLVHDLCFTLGAIAACHYLHLIPGLELPRHRGLQDRPRGGGGAADAGRLLGERDHRELRPHPRGPRQEPAADAADDQRQREPDAEPDDPDLDDGVPGVDRALHVRRRGRPPVRVRDGDGRDGQHVQFDLRRLPAACCSSARAARR